MTEPAMNGNNSHLPSQEPTIDITGVGDQGAGNVAAGMRPSGEHQQPAMTQPTMEQVVQMLWAERTQTQAQNQQLQQHLSQIQSAVHSQTIIQPSVKDFSTSLQRRIRFLVLPRSLNVGLTKRSCKWTSLGFRVQMTFFA
jgi:hypothetical protein